MSEKPLRQRIPLNRRIKPSHTSSSPSTHKLGRKPNVRSDHSKVIKRCNSEPTLLTDDVSIAGAGVGDDHQNMTPPGGDGCFMVRNRIISKEVFSSSPELLPNSPLKSKVYNKDAKVVVKVNVEGSVGPIRALVKLGSTVDETIKLVMNKYNEHGRTPRLEQDTLTSFELHLSNFSLRCLEKSDVIGDIGSRSFYMRKSVNNDPPIDSKTVVDTSNNSPSRSSNNFIPSFMHQEFKKMIQRTCGICRLLCCFGG